jgi:hypothetical protein
LTHSGCAKITKSGMTTKQTVPDHQSRFLVIRVRAAENSVGDQAVLDGC